MKAVRIARDPISVGKLKTDVSRLLKEIAAGSGPLVITCNGKPAGVIISPEEYDRIQERDRFVAAVEQGLRHKRAGRVHSNEEVTRLLDRPAKKSA